MAACESEAPPGPGTTLPGENPGTKPDPDPGPENLEFTSFAFERWRNPEHLQSNVTCTIDGDEITAHLPHTNDPGSLTPSFEGDFDKVMVGGEEQKSGRNAQDFTTPVLYTLVDPNGYQRTYRVTVRTGSGLPVVRIDTKDRLPVTDKKTFIDGTIAITNAPGHGGDFQAALRIRGRGNATWDAYPKKPYRLKLDRKASLMGFPEHRDWALLAEYCDKSLLRTSYMWEAARIADMEWVCRAQHVEMYLNDSYIGVYLLCENIKEGPGRIDLDADGFIIEADQYWDREPLWLTTSLYNQHYSFKYPDPDGDIVSGDANYRYIGDFLAQFETALYSSNFANPGTGYRKYIDAESFAKWYLVQEMLGNIDTNPYYVMLTRGDKLKMYPPWDAEWSVGLASDEGRGWLYPPTVSPVEKLYWKNKLYFGRLTQDPWFCDLLRTEWAAMKKRLPEFEANMETIRSNLTYAQASNFRKWDILGRYISVGLVKFPTWEQETEYAADFLTKRIEWFDERIEKFPE